MTKFDPRDSIVARLTVTLGLIAVAVFAVTGAMLSIALERELLGQESREIRGKMELVQHLLTEHDQRSSIEDLTHTIDDMLVAHGDLHVWIKGKDGSLIFGREPLPAPAASASERGRFLLSDGTSASGMVALQPGNGLMTGSEITIALDTKPRIRLMSAYASAATLIGTLGVLATVVLAAWAANRSFQPVRLLATQASRITPEHLGVRLPIQDADAELRTLSQSFNAALDRLEEAYGKLEAFNADVAHELRTPLATLISGIEVTLAAERSNADLRELHGSNLEVLRQMRSIVNDMLFLARADVGEKADGLAEVSLAEQARQVIEIYEALIQDREISVSLTGDARIACNAGLVRRAISNLLSNALKFSDPGGAVLIAVTELDEYARIAVRNTGPTIPAENLSRFFDRFFRGDLSRSVRGESQGLGLSIVQAVAKMHGGWAQAKSAKSQTEVSFALACGLSATPRPPNLRARICADS